MLSHFRGMLFPDEFVTRFFFKLGLSQTPGSVLELGAGNGNNLSLFYQFGWQVCGVDHASQAIQDAEHNFAFLKQQFGLTQPYTFVQQDMLRYLETCEPQAYDAVLLPNAINYLPLDAITRLFELLQQKALAKPGGAFFVKVRSVQDYRYRRGSLLQEQSSVIDSDETGEAGCVNTCLHEYQLIQLIERFMPLQKLYLMHSHYDNYQQDALITHNADMIVWGRTLP